MARLPQTIYRDIMKRQKELYKSGATDGSIALLTAYEVFFEAGYKQSTANKWILNWAICRRCMIEKKGGHYRLRLGEFTDKTPEDCINGAWLPVKDVWITDDSGKKSKGMMV